ncbi:MAG TPA: ATP-binding protein [Longimicrobiales bacterium]|nr:ATP-binding protein [Longimicrobiales bacterium]
MGEEHSPRTTGPARTGRKRARAAFPWDIVAHSPLALAVLHPETFAVRCMSTAFLSVTGAAQDDLLDRPFPDLLPASGAEKVRSALSASRDTGAPGRAADVSYVHPERGPVRWDCTVWSVPDPEGGTGRLSVHISVMTDQAPERGQLSLLADQIRAANEQLLLAGVRQLELAEQARRHAQQIDDLLVSLAGGVLVVDGSGQAVLANGPARQMLGLPDPADPGFAARLQQLDLRYPDGSMVPTGDRPVERVLRGERFADLDLSLRRADGEPVRFAFNGSAIEDGGSGEVTLAILVFYEVTAKRRLEDLRADYISLISHDLRSPLTAILGYAELVQVVLKGGATGEVAGWMERIQEAAQRMAAMIEDLVESTRLESGVLKLHREPADLRALTNQAMAHLPSPEDRRRIHIEAPAHPLRASIDHGRFERVVTNLISNALKYSAPTAPVAVRLREREGELVLSVTDRGPGLSPKSISRLFQRFYRVEPGARIEGIGLGLYIARLIVEAHGGRIWVDSEIGKGSTFSVSLPLELAGEP